MSKPKLRIGLIGSGFMGKAHAFGYTIAARVFDLPFEPELHSLADSSEEVAEKAGVALGFARATGEWRTLVADPEINVVNISAPNRLHKEMALAAITAGKHVYCEKPLAPLTADAREMAEADEASGMKTQVGFNYLCNPMLRLARDMITAGELGEIRSYRGLHVEDYMADASGPLHLPCAGRHRQPCSRHGRVPNAPGGGADHPAWPSRAGHDPRRRVRLERLRLPQPFAGRQGDHWHELERTPPETSSSVRMLDMAAISGLFRA